MKVQLVGGRRLAEEGAPRVGTRPRSRRAAGVKQNKVLAAGIKQKKVHLVGGEHASAAPRWRLGLELSGPLKQDSVS
eukprot:NODE_20310_length_804_cov_1.621861.p3 GENE.NODE_20310_length_804_cov_1.621861~~NODE_20310_length_804_cov_1.621861.p3  ORF type:complete len:77 (-),score=10.84 NODE_20310_length_804_cov_1.621861:503-733(-)